MKSKTPHKHKNQKQTITWLVWLCICSFNTIASQTTPLAELINKKQFRKAIAWGDSLVQNNTLDHHSLYLIGQAYEGVKHYSEAFVRYKLIFEQDTTHLETLYALARVAGSLGRPKEAEAFYLRVIDQDSTDFYANYQLALLYTQIDEIDQALHHYRFLLDADSTNSHLWRKRGDCYLTKNDVASACLCYLTGMSYNRGDPLIAHSLINALLQLGGDNISEAFNICNIALSHNPDNLFLRRDQANIFYTNKQYSESDSLYTQLISEGDSCYQVVKYLGASRFKSGKFYDSIDPLKLAYNADSSSVEVAMLYGAALGKTYDRERALQLLHHVDSLLRPDSIIVMMSDLYKAEFLMKQSHTRQQAIDLYYDIYKRYPRRTEILSTIAIQYANGSTDPFNDEVERQRMLFIVPLTIRMIHEKKQPHGSVTKNAYRHILQSIVNEMFFTQKERLPTLAPDGMKGVITRNELIETIELLK